MSAVVRKTAAAVLIVAASASSVSAVGLGPLTNMGVTISERKGFYLTLVNPYPVQERFNLYGVEWETDHPIADVRIPISKPFLGPKSQRRILIIVTNLVPGEVRKFRVCAERIEAPGKEVIHARVCSKLIAHRVG